MGFLICYFCDLEISVNSKNSQFQEYSFQFYAVISICHPSCVETLCYTRLNAVYCSFIVNSLRLVFIVPNLFVNLSFDFCVLLPIIMYP